MDRVDRFKQNPEKALLTLSVPVIIAMLVQVAYNLTDTAFVGRIGVDALAAVTFSFPLFFLLIAAANLIGSGATTLIAQRLGAKRDARRVAGTALGMSLVAGLLTTTIGIPLVDPLFRLLGATPAVAALGHDYMVPVLAASTFLYIGSTFAAILNGEGSTKVPSITRTGTAVLNVALDALFILGFGWGVTGAALATAIAFSVDALLLGAFVLGGKSHVTPSKEPSWTDAKAILRIGVPTSAAQLLMSLSFLFYNSLFAQYGTAEVAAYGLVGRLDSLAFMPLMGLSIGLVTLVGMFYGAGEYALLVRVFKAMLRYGLLYVVPLGILFYALPGVFLRILTDDAALIALATPFIRIEVLVYPLMLVGFTIGRTLQGLGHGTPSLIIQGVRLVVLAVPLAWLFSFLGYGPRSVYVATLLAGAASVAIAVPWMARTLRGIRASETH